MTAMDLSDLVIDHGFPLGKGGFSNVYKVIEVKDSNALMATSREFEVDKNNDEIMNEPHTFDINDGHILFDTKDSSVLTDELFRRKNRAESILSDISSDTATTTCSTSAHTLNHRHHHQQHFALKVLRDDLSKRGHERGLVDMAIEATLISSLSHPHIIQLFGVSPHLEQLQNLYENDLTKLPPMNDPRLESYYQSNDYFLVLELLQSETLECRIRHWADNFRVNYNISSNFLNKTSCLFCWMLHSVRNEEQYKEKVCREFMFWLERITIARNIARAIHHLHSNGIVYRDLKPSNIGFDLQGNVKMFDFGLAKKLRPDELQSNGLYNMTGNTGSLLYMSPEVALHKPYDVRVDTYSFGILLWQICAMEKPFMGFNRNSHLELVVRGGYRPPIDGYRSWPICCYELIEMCWAHDIHIRPSFDHIVTILDQEVLRITEKISLIMDSGVNATNPLF